MELANATVTRVNDALHPIREQVDQWEQTYGNASATNEDINNALMEANKTGRSPERGETFLSCQNPGSFQKVVKKKSFLLLFIINLRFFSPLVIIGEN